MLVAIYARVSSDEQAEKGTSLKAQEEALRKYSVQHGYQVYQTYVDDGYSAGTLNRPHFQQLLRDAHDKKFEVVLVTKTDRFARNQGDALSIVDKEFVPNGIQLISIAEPFDHREPTGKLQFGIHAGFAEYERAVIRERTLSGRRRRASEGKCMVNTRCLGYSKDKDNNWTIDQKGAQIYYQITKWLVEEKMTTRQIAGRLNTAGTKTPSGRLWNHTTINRMLRNRVYLGEGRYGPIRYKLPALIDKYRYLQIANALSANATNTKPLNHYVSVLKGLLRCGECKTWYKLHVTPKPNGKIYRYYICGSYYNDQGLNKTPCHCRWVKYDEVLFAVRERVRRALTSQQFINELLTDQHSKENGELLNYEAEKIVADKTVRDKEQQITKLIELYTTTGIAKSLLDKQIQKYQQELSEAEKTREDLVRKINEQDRIFKNINQIKTEVELIGQRLDNNELAQEEVKRLFKKIIASVVVTYNAQRKRYAYLIKTKWDMPTIASKPLKLKS